jgi:DNA-binding MarR family transcriptional regulator
VSADQQGQAVAGGDALDDTTRERLGSLLQRAELASMYQRAARARQLGMPQVELTALEHLVALGGLTPGALGHRLGLTSGGVTALAGRLIGAGLVERSPHPSDRRMRVLTATDAGRERLAEFLEPVLAPASRLVAWLSTPQAALIDRFLDSLVLLAEREAAATPGPPAERSGDSYTPALLM